MAVGVRKVTGAAAVVLVTGGDRAEDTPFTLFNSGGVSVSLGGSTVAVGTGFPLGVGMGMSGEISAGESIYGISTGAGEVSVLELRS